MDNPVDIELQRRYTEDTKPPNPTAMDKWMIDFSRALPVVIIGLVGFAMVVAGVVAVFKCWAMKIDREVYSDESMLELQAYASFTASNRRRPKSSTSPR